MCKRLRIVTVFCLIAMQSLNAYAHGTDDVPAYYDVDTGNVTIDVTIVERFGSYVWGIPFDGFNADGYTPFMNSPLTSQTSRLLGGKYRNRRGGCLQLGGDSASGTYARGIDELFLTQ